MLTPREIGRVRSHPSSIAVGNSGWRMLADRNACGNVVYLVQEAADVAIEFHHEEPYHDFLRKQCKAEAYARENPCRPQESPKKRLIIASLTI
jgi:hypothetical protein